MYKYGDCRALMANTNPGVRYTREMGGACPGFFHSRHLYGGSRSCLRSPALRGTKSSPQAWHDRKQSSCTTQRVWRWASPKVLLEPEDARLSAPHRPPWSSASAGDPAILSPYASASAGSSCKTSSRHHFVRQHRHHIFYCLNEMSPLPHPLGLLLGS